MTGSQRQGFFAEPSTRSIQILGCNIHDNGGNGPVHLDHNIYIQGQGHVIANCRIANGRARSLTEAGARLNRASMPRRVGSASA